MSRPVCYIRNKRFAQGVGQALWEHCIVDPDSGQVMTGSFMDYTMPRAGLVGGLRVIDHAVPTATNPLGAKGVGESATVGAPPAIANAVVDALRHLGVTHFDIPITPEKVWTVLKAKGVAE